MAAFATSPAGEFVRLDGENFYRIASYQHLAPFMMSLANDTDLWMFVASGGGLTAGRVDAEGSLFPYHTSDQLHDAHHHTGPLTLLQVERKQGTYAIWEPFSDANAENPVIERNLYKNTIGNRLVFEEINHELGMSFSYRWASCDEFGWVRTAKLNNLSTTPVRVSLLDGLRNILPFGAPLGLYQTVGNLVDAYKKTEVDPDTGLGVFSLTAGISDRTEALEVLRANTVWCCGLDEFRVHLSPDAIAAFRNGRIVTEESVRNGQRGNYLVTTCLDLEADQSTQWHLVGDTGRDHVQISEIRAGLCEGKKLAGRITESLALADENLRHIVASADGLQMTGNTEASTHHFANVLFNNMRGGVFTQNHELPVADFVDFLQLRNRVVAERQAKRLATWPELMTVLQLRQSASAAKDADFERLAHEYLPLYFGRRHGDPSRPWNRFSIRVRDRNGQRALNYEGNWRDIFQNWEALSTSFPGFLPSIVAKFVNASTVDGFNPYRITRDGVDWETTGDEDPWSNIGYWGDHQIIYLLKLLEAMNDHDPILIQDMLGAEIFSYAEVPYIIKPYAEILVDSRATIEFDNKRAARIDKRVAKNGNDGKLLTNADGSVYHANLLEKILLPALSKLSNFIPDAGIWMNTQRPEWNDANNALGGGGISVVTLCYLRRYLTFLADLLAEIPDRQLPVATEIAAWFAEIEAVFTNEVALLATDTMTGEDRRRLMDLLGRAFSTYRETVYAGGFNGRQKIAISRVTGLFRTALKFVDRSIAANRRDDGLYHTYNLLEMTGDETEASVVHLQEMLEGQVAVISSGILEPAETLEILANLFDSAMYRPDQHSFMLYPIPERSGFLTKNLVPEESVASIPLLKSLLSAGDNSLLARDIEGVCRFHGDFKNAEDLTAVLDTLSKQERWTIAVAEDRDAVHALFESVFNHKSYTGRSGVMYGYEGIGCIYWHMVAKLLLAVQEISLRAERENQPDEIQDALAEMYFRIRSGLGYERSVSEYGAFPTDPYSHTPLGAGAKQPGMTGQVKEEILTRFGELGVSVEAGAVHFQPVLLQANEFLKQPEVFPYYDIHGKAGSIKLPAGSLAFTYCQVPVVYEQVPGEAWIHIEFDDGTSHEHDGNVLEASLGAELSLRSGRIQKIQVGITESTLR